jgi:hypothetical protein
MFQYNFQAIKKYGANSRNTINIPSLQRHEWVGLIEGLFDVLGPKVFSLKIAKISCNMTIPP